MDDQYAGRPVRCPTCKSVLTVPGRAVAQGQLAHALASPAPLPPPAPRIPPSVPIHRTLPPSRETLRRFGFACPWCSSRLEATLATAGQSGQCPTCGNTIRIPIMDRFGRLIDPDTRKILKPDPHPVHAYAAAGDKAPHILRAENGTQSIECSRCRASNPINANSCRGCGIPFTLEGTVQIDRGATSGFATTSLVLGILGIPLCMVFVPSILAIIFGIVALLQLRSTENRSARITAIAGISCGAAGLIVNFLMYMR